MRVKLNHFLLATTLLACGATANAETIEDGRYWFNISLLGPTSIDSYSWTLDLRPRWREEGSKFDQFIASAFVLKHLNAKTSFGLGVDHVVNHPASRESFEENRLSSQLLHQFNEIAGIKLQSRTRFEFRQREDFDDTAYRLREQIRASYPLSVNPNVSIVVFDELLMNLNNTDWNVRRGIDQNRVFVGMNYQLNSHASIETGYLNQTINTRSIDRENHIINSTLRYRF